MNTDRDLGDFWKAQERIATIMQAVLGQQLHRIATSGEPVSGQELHEMATAAHICGILKTQAQRQEG